MTLSWKWVEENKWKTSRVHFLFDRFEKYKAKALIHDTPGEHRATHIFQKKKKMFQEGSRTEREHTHTHTQEKKGAPPQIDSFFKWENMAGVGLLLFQRNS